MAGWTKHTPEERRAYAQQRTKELSETVEAIGRTWRDNPEEIAEYMAFAGRFRQYSARNQLLIQHQMPAAHFVAGLKQFNEMGYRVKAGEHGIQILVPVKKKAYRLSPADPWLPLSKDVGEEIRRGIRSGQYETGERVVGFNATTVFDISQTSCPREDYPKIIGMGYDSVPHAEVYRNLCAVCEEMGFAVQEAALPPELRGTCDGQTIQINALLGDTQKLSTLCHELGHAALEHTASRGEKSTAQRELEADAFSVAASSCFGVEVSDVRKAHLADVFRTYCAEQEQAGQTVDIVALLDPVNRAFGQVAERMEQQTARQMTQPEPAPARKAAAPALADAMSEPGGNAPSPSPRLFVDMDGTLAQFHAEHDYLERMWEPGFFEHLAPYESAVMGLQTFMRTHPDVEVYILSAAIAGDPPGCAAQKNAWLDRWLPEIDAAHRLFPPVGEDKTAFIPGGVRETDTLLDDYNVNLEQWRDAGGCGVKFVNHINDRGLVGKRWEGDRVRYDRHPDFFAMDVAQSIGWRTLPLTFEIRPDGTAKVAYCDKEASSAVTIPAEVGGHAVTGIGDRAFDGVPAMEQVLEPLEPPGLTFMLYSDGTAEVVHCDKSVSGAVTIPAEVGGHAVTGIGDRAFLGCTSLTSVTMPDGVTHIDDAAFAHCSSLTDVTMPDGVTNIGYWAFADCASLADIAIPSSVTTIGRFAFQGCKSLKSVTIPSSVTSISNAAFAGCESLKSVTIPGSVTAIGRCAFYGCTSLESITIPSGVTSIGDRAFSGCTSLTDITIPDSVTTIGDSAFDGVPAMEQVLEPLEP